MFRTALLDGFEGSWRGFRADGDLDVSELAEQVLGPTMHGGECFAYLFRRFGYPNIGWDDYKDLVQYLLSTPMTGLGLIVRPYLGEPTTDLMFSVMMDEELSQRWHRSSPRVVEWEEMFEKARAWAGDRFVLVYEAREVCNPAGWYMRDRQEGEAATLMERPVLSEDADDEERAACDRQAAFNRALIKYWAAEHPAEMEARANAREALWAMPQRERPGLVGEVARALSEAMEDLLRPTYVRDVPFNILGRDNLPDLEPEVYARAGCTAEYLFRSKEAPQVLEVPA